jgi:hypothetical protein
VAHNTGKGFRSDSDDRLIEAAKRQALDGGGLPLPDGETTETVPPGDSPLRTELEANLAKYRAALAEEPQAKEPSGGTPGATP